MDHSFNIILASAFIFMSVTFGNYSLMRCSFSFSQPLEAFLFSTAIGGGLLSSGILLIGLLNGFHKLIFLLLFLFCVLIARKHLRITILLIQKGIHCLRENVNFFPLIVFGFAAVFMICRALAPPTDWDSLTLHLRVPAQFLEKGGIYLPEDNLAAAFVQLVHMWYAFLLAFGGAAGPALLNTFFALALCLAVYAFSLRFFNPLTASLGLGIFWANSVILLVAITSRVDVILAFFLFLAHYALLKARGNLLNRRYFYLSAVLFGFSVGIKYNAIFYILAISPLIVWLLVSSSIRFSSSTKHFLYFGSLVVIAASPWLIKNYLQFNSILYPFFTDRRPEPWLEPFYLGSSQGSSLIKATIAESIQHMAKPFNLLDYIKAPGQLMVELEGHFYNFNVIFFVLPFGLLFLRNRALICLIIPAILYALMLIFFWPFSNLRYLIPSLIPLTIVGSYIMAELCNRFLKTRMIRNLCVCLMIFIALISPARAMYFWPSNEMSLKYLSGLSSKEVYLCAKSMPTRVYADLVLFVNQNLSEKDKLLMIMEARGYYFRVPVIQDNELSNWTLLSQKNVTAKYLKSLSVSHVLVNTKGPVYLQGRGMDLSIFRLDELRVFSERYLEPIYKNEGYVLFALKN